MFQLLTNDAFRKVNDNPMFAAERLQKIKRILVEYKKVDVSNLSNLLSVSEVTIRKDLERLEVEGFLTRTHGGAVLIENGNTDDIYAQIEVPELEHKKTIGLIAAQMVNNSEAIFLGTGTTCVQVAKNLKDKKNLTIVTNNVTAAIEVADVPGIRVVLTGGDIRAKDFSYSLVGSSIVQSLNNIYVDKAFIGVDGISFKRGFTLHDSDEAAISSEILKYTNEFIVLADSTKFNKIAFCKLGDLTMAKKIISDEQVPEEYITYCFENNIQMFTTYKLNI